MQIISEQADVLTYPSIFILWGGLNGNLASDATKIQIGGSVDNVVYTYADAYVAQIAYFRYMAILKTVTLNQSATADFRIIPSETQITIASITPSNPVIEGTVSTVTGENFTEDMQIYVGLEKADFILVDINTLYLVMPANANGTYKVMAFRENGDQYVFTDVTYNTGSTNPFITSISPSTVASGMADHDITINGSGFTNAGDEFVVIGSMGFGFGYSNALSFVSVNEVTAFGLNLPAGVYSVTYTNAIGTSTLPNALTVT